MKVWVIVEEDDTVVGVVPHEASVQAARVVLRHATEALRLVRADMTHLFPALDDFRRAELQRPYVEGDRVIQNYVEDGETNLWMEYRLIACEVEGL